MFSQLAYAVRATRVLAPVVKQTNPLGLGVLAVQPDPKEGTTAAAEDAKPTPSAADNANTAAARRKLDLRPFIAVLGSPIRTYQGLRLDVVVLAPFVERQVCPGPPNESAAPVMSD